MGIFFAPFAAIAVSAAQDLWEVVPPANSWVEIREIHFGQYTDAGDASAELLGVTITRGHTVSGSGGSTITPVPENPATGAAASTTTVERNNTTQANTGGQLMHAEAWNIQTPFMWSSEKHQRRLLMRGSQRLVISITAPADSITMNGTLVFEELGQGAS